MMVALLPILYPSFMKDGNDELWRSPGTPVFTAPECCLGNQKIFVSNLHSMEL